MTPEEQDGTLKHLRDPNTSTPMDVGKMATAATVKNVVLSHLTRRPGTDDYTPWAEEVKRHFSGEVFVAKDLLEFSDACCSLGAGSRSSCWRHSDEDLSGLQWRRCP